MENDIIDSLNDIGYVGPLTDEDEFNKAVEKGAKSLEFNKLVHIIAQELKNLCQLEETVNIMSDADESNSFLLELSSFLKELGCPYKCLVTGYMSSRLQSRENCLLLLDYLISELMAARMVNIESDGSKKTMEIVMQESSTAKDLKEILITLKFNKPPPNITPEMLFSKLEAKLKDTIAKQGQELVGKPLYNKALNEKDWKQLEIAYEEMYEDYSLRKETLITRLECTVQSFQWSDRLKKDVNLIQSAYRTKREKLKSKPEVKLSDFLAARTSLLQVEKTSSANVRKNTRSDVNKVIIGQVPDRGGRPNEQPPPPPEMPSWQQRTPGGGRGGGGGGGRGGGGFGGRGGHDSGRGGRDSGRGGYDSSRGSFDSGRGGYNSGRGGYDSGRNDHDGGQGGYGRGGRGGRGGRVQGAYSQGNSDHGRPQTNPGNYNPNRNYQTYEVPPGGYNQDQGYVNNMGQSNSYSSNNARSVTYGSSGGTGYSSLDLNSSQNQYSNPSRDTGYSSNYRNRGNGGYQNEHDDRDRRGRGGGYYRGGRR